jgi:hypothetical protein
MRIADTITADVNAFAAQAMVYYLTFGGGAGDGGAGFFITCMAAFFNPF